MTGIISNNNILFKISFLSCPLLGYHPTFVCGNIREKICHSLGICVTVTYQRCYDNMTLHKENLNIQGMVGRKDWSWFLVCILQDEVYYTGSKYSKFFLLYSSSQEDFIILSTIPRCPDGLVGLGISDRHRNPTLTPQLATETHLAPTGLPFFTLSFNLTYNLPLESTLVFCWKSYPRNSMFTGHL